MQGTSEEANSGIPWLNFSSFSDLNGGSRFSWQLFEFVRDMTSAQTISLICMFFSVCSWMLDTYLQFPISSWMAIIYNFRCFWDAIFYNFYA